MWMTREEYAEHGAAFPSDPETQLRMAIEAVLARGKAPSADCYTWERGGPW